MLWDIKVKYSLASRLPVTEDILSDQQQKVWATGIWPVQSRVKIYLILACRCSLFLLTNPRTTDRCVFHWRDCTSFIRMAVSCVVYRETRSGVNGNNREQPYPDVKVRTIYGSSIAHVGSEKALRKRICYVI